jgi:hypothetical protein
MKTKLLSLLRRPSAISWEKERQSCINCHRNSLFYKVTNISQGSLENELTFYWIFSSKNVQRKKYWFYYHYNVYASYKDPIKRYQQQVACWQFRTKVNPISFPGTSVRIGSRGRLITHVIIALENFMERFEV